MNGNLFVTEAKNGRRSNRSRLIITTGSKRKRHVFRGIGTESEFAIGQRALLLQSDGGNLFWDCITLRDGQTAAELNARGGIRAIAISHPHYYTTMVDWAERFDAQIFLHTADREWVMRKSPRIRFWEGTTLSLWDGLTLITCGGHFEGGAVSHWPAGANGKGALLTDDIIQVVQDRRYVSFMRSYPNLIPLGAGRDPTYSRKNRTILIRTNLRRVVESERSLRCKSGGAPFSRTVPPRHQKRREDVQRTPKVPRLGDETEQASSLILHQVLLGCDASSHRFHDPDVLRSNHLINNLRQCDCSRLADSLRCKFWERRCLGIHFDKFAATTAGSQRRVGHAQRLENLGIDLIFPGFAGRGRDQVAEQPDSGVGVLRAQAIESWVRSSKPK